jgi:hypothetical protein
MRLVIDGLMEGLNGSKIYLVGVCLLCDPLQLICRLYSDVTPGDKEIYVRSCLLTDGLMQFLCIFETRFCGGLFVI